MPSFTLSIPSVGDHPELVRIWEASVRATHHFLPEDYLLTLRGLLLDQYLRAVDLIAARDDTGHWLGFAGTTPGVLEMLFIAPEQRGKGIGKQLLDYTRKHHGVREVDVNEQNPQAIGFYLAQGFSVVSRSEVDGLGQPYPILRMRVNAPR